MDATRHTGPIREAVGEDPGLADRAGMAGCVHAQASTRAGPALAMAARAA